MGELLTLLGSLCGPCEPVGTSDCLAVGVQRKADRNGTVLLPELVSGLQVQLKLPWASSKPPL